METLKLHNNLLKKENDTNYYICIRYFEKTARGYFDSNTLYLINLKTKSC